MLQVVAGIIEMDGYILLCQRHRDSKRFPLKWEFPGGKVETNERPKDAIVRELNEELGIRVTGIEAIEDYDFAYPGEKIFHLYFYKILDFEQSIVNRQFEAMAWVQPADMVKYDLLDGDKPFIERLK
jgi:8-oxo-dGTP diphosphatase